MHKEYTDSLTRYSRWKTREVMVGEVGIGGLNPIRVQSMTTTDTMDTLATVEQSIRMIKAGCELVRITAPSLKEAANLENIKKELRSRGYQTPLIADIHFTPNAAELAARIVEKVRVNPGNYADKKKFEHIEYTDSTYNAELDRIHSRFTPLVKICKEHGTAMRIGTNHGSLSDRILSRYGDTPLGMVESAFEFLYICREEGFHEIILSMKASNTQVMVQAYRLLVSRMREESMNYPLHLGVTEAGEGEDGRIKSAVGIGTLLEDGIGDTVRVSLTEDPEFEIPVAKNLVARYTNRAGHNTIAEIDSYPNLPYSPYEHERRKSLAIRNLGENNAPVVVSDLSRLNEITAATLFQCGYSYSIPLDKWNLSDQACDYIYTGDKVIDFEIPGTLGVICDADVWKLNPDKPLHYPLFSCEDFLRSLNLSPALNFVTVTAERLLAEQSISSAFTEKIKSTANIVLIIETENAHAMAELRRIMIELLNKGIMNPVIIKWSYEKIDAELLQLYAATDVGALLLDGFGDGVWIKSPENISPKKINQLSFNILQAARVRISKTEYISCPSCGRTLFDLQETTAMIRSRTNHLKGVKIGIMGCIVNGPGEMADADYGYVGSGPGKITLYKGREVVRKNIASEGAVDALIDLIKQHGDWVEEQVENIH